MADFEGMRNFAASVQSVVTAGSFIVGGFWVYLKYVKQVENFAHIESTADINIIGDHGDYWIVEFAGIVENKGKVRHKIHDLKFDVNALFFDDVVETSTSWGGQVDFPHKIIEGSFLPRNTKYFFVDPGVKARYSFNGRVDKQAHMVVFHWWFEYGNQPGHKHVAEKSALMTNGTG
jgi:hypothetical protein